MHRNAVRNHQDDVNEWSSWPFVKHRIHTYYIKYQTNFIHIASVSICIATFQNLCKQFATKVSRYFLCALVDNSLLHRKAASHRITGIIATSLYLIRYYRYIITTNPILFEFLQECGGEFTRNLLAHKTLENSVARLLYRNIADSMEAGDSYCCCIED